MADPRFDSARAVRIDVARGTVMSSLDERLVFVGAGVLQRLVDAAHGEVLEALGQSLGAPIGQRIAVRFGGVAQVRKAPFALIAEHLQGETAVTGLGSLALEVRPRTPSRQARRPRRRGVSSVRLDRRGGVLSRGGRAGAGVGR